MISKGKSQSGATRIGAWEVGHRPGDFGKILNKSPVESGVTEKTANTLHDSRM
ncbi:hypothetical protein Tco_0380141, partial [Tanacetum coccineum]